MLKRFIKITIVVIIGLMVRARYVYSDEEKIEYIPYNKDMWFQNWRNTMFESTPIHFCFIIDDSASTSVSDPRKVRDIVLNKFISNMGDNDLFSVVQDIGDPYSYIDAIIVHEPTKDKNILYDAINTRNHFGAGNAPAYSVDKCIDFFSSYKDYKNVIVHLGDGGFGYSYDASGGYPGYTNLIDSNMDKRVSENNVSFFSVGFTNDASNYTYIETGALRKYPYKHNGKYYRLRIGDGDTEDYAIIDAVEESNTNNSSDDTTENKCEDKEYAEQNAGKCCSKYPETCTCSNQKYAKSHSSECNSCDNEEYKKEHKDMCTTVSCNGTEMKLRDVKTLNRLFEYIKTILNIVKICVPIILILMGTIDMVKAMIANNEDSKKNYNLFIRRCIYAVCIFLLGTLINFVLGLVGAKYYDCDEVAISDNSEVSMINK